MDTFQFLSTILPRTGLYVLAKDVGYGFDHTLYTDIQSMAKAALSIDARGETIYHARSSFANEIRPLNGHRNADGTHQAGVRNKDNVLFMRSLAIDLDVGPRKEYDSQKQAAEAVQFTCKQLSIPLPMLISSGRGVHGYWVWDRDVPREEAEPICQAFVKMAEQHNLRIDTGVTKNIASVLRPVGTHWRKDGEREVRLLLFPGAVSFDRMREALAPFTIPSEIKVDDEWSLGPRTHPPSSAHEIVKHCSAVAAMAASSGALPEPLWWAMLGVVKHCTEGEALAHEWSAGDPRYSEADTKAKFDSSWLGGPPTCDRIASLGGLCQGCTHKVKTPIQLGYTLESPPVAPFIPIVTVPPSISFARRNEIKDIPFWMSKYGWNNLALTAQQKTKLSDGSEVVEVQPFANRWFYPYKRTRGEDGTMVLKCCARGVRGAWDEFEMPTAHLADTRSLLKTLAEHEIIPCGGKTGVDLMRQYVQDLMQAIERHEDETITYNTFGWHRRGFVLGTTLVQEQSDGTALLGERIPPELRHGMRCAGTVERWAELIDQIYNREGAEPYQMMILASFAAPLIALTGIDIWHGIPIALTGESGLGKTTTCLVAASVWGRPGDFLVSSHEAGVTMNALTQTVAVYRHLPVILDEVHGMPGMTLPTLLYALSNGKPKRALRSDRSFRATDQWDTITFVTSNQSIMGLLALFDRAKAEATQLRVFEVALPKGFNERVFGGLNAKDLIERQLLSENYGEVGRIFLRRVMHDREAVVQLIHKVRAKYVPKEAEDNKERFYRDLIAMVAVAGLIAKQLNLVKFDINNIITWMNQNIRDLRQIRKQHLPDFRDHLYMVFNELMVRAVQTKAYPRSRPNRSVPTEHVNWVRNEPPLARYVSDEQIAIVPLASLRTVCAKLQIPVRDFMLRCTQEGITYTPAYLGLIMDKMYPFRGTDLPHASAQTSCMIFNMKTLIQHTPGMFVVQENGELKSDRVVEIKGARPAVEDTDQPVASEG
jgi:hypothetical protein